MVMLVFLDVGVLRVAHFMTEYMDDLQNLMWEHSEQFIHYVVWAWRFVVAKSLDALNESIAFKDLGVGPLSRLKSLGFIPCVAGG